MNVIKKLISGSDYRASRLHDESGARVSFSECIKHGPKALGTTLIRLMSGRRPELPWVPYRVIAEFDRFLDPHKRVLEFGSGMSTAWYAARAKEVISIEHDPQWFEWMSQRIEQRQIKNIRYLQQPIENYTDCIDQLNAPFDLIIVDGPKRDVCVAKALPLLSENGWFYLDNSDRSHESGDDAMDRARQMLNDAQHKGEGTLETFTGFVPALAFASTDQR